jgi:ribulose 1,5-bisphosphate carboxylase large subunit-like protein
MSDIALTISVENADEKALHRFVDDLQKLHDLPQAAIDETRRSETVLELVIRYPLSMFDRSVSQLMATLFGEIPFMRAFGKARFENLEFPEAVFHWFAGPAFGAEAVLNRFGAVEPPLLVAILKPSLDAEGTLEQLEARIAGPVSGGFHIAKDDEMQGDFPNVPLDVRLALAVRNRRYVPAVNLDDPGAFRHAISNADVGMVIINPTIIGFPLLHELRKSTKVPLLGHLSMQGMYAACFSHRIFAQLHRLFGCDALITPIGETHYYRASKADEWEIADELTRDLPIAKTLPLLTGGGSLRNLAALMVPYEAAKKPYGIVLGGLIFNSPRPPAEMAKAVVDEVCRVKTSGHRARL